MTATVGESVEVGQARPLLTRLLEVMVKNRHVSLARMFLSVAFFAGAAGCFHWTRYLVSAQLGHEYLVAALVFGIPTLLIGGIVCLASSTRNALIVSGIVFAGFVLLAIAANKVVPLLK